MRVAVVGTGHVGLITGAALASLQHDVVGMDVSAEKVAMLQRAEAPFHEPDLDDLLREGIDDGHLRFTTSVRDAVEDATVAFICVGRPPVGQGDRSLTAVEGAVRELADAATPGIVLVVKSTVPPGTTGRIEDVVRRTRPELDFSTVSSPEFLREGHAVEDTLRPDRLVVGSDDARGFAVMRELYAPILAAGHRMIETDPRTAELSKLASNAFLATKISFANALARVAELAGADVDGVTAIMGADPRIGAGLPGCRARVRRLLPAEGHRDLEKFAGRLGYDFGILREAVRANEDALAAVTRKVEEAVWNLEGKKVALLGIAFKPGTDDVRGAPALGLAAALREEGAIVAAFDPMAAAAAAEEDPDLVIATDAYAAAEGADCVVICTEWPEFGALDLDRLSAAMRQPAIVDGRNLMDPEAVVAAGFRYFPVGRVGRSYPD